MSENDFALNILSEVLFWEHAKEFQSVTKHAVQLKIIWLQITPYIRNTIDPNVSSAIDTFGLCLSLCMIAYIVLETIVVMAQNKKPIAVNVYVFSL